MNDKHSSKLDAHSALQSIIATKQTASTLLQMPLWLNFILSSAYGLGVFCWAISWRDTLWLWGVSASIVVFSVSVIFYLRTKWQYGIKPRFAAKSKSEFVFFMVISILLGVITALSRELAKQGSELAPYIGAIMAGSLLGYTIHKFPLGQFKSGESCDKSAV